MSIEPLARTYGLSSIIATVEDIGRLDEALSGVRLIVNAAGPFSQTAGEIAAKAIEHGIDYVDVGGEIDVLTHLFGLHSLAAASGSRILPSCAFQIVPSDAIAAYLHERMPEATTIEVALDATTRPAPGTLKASLNVIAGGGLAVRDGALVTADLGATGPTIPFHDGSRTTFLSPLADLVTIGQRTGVANISSYLAHPRGTAKFSAAIPPASRLLRIEPVRNLASWAIPRLVKPPTERPRDAGSFWGRAIDDKGNTQEAWLRTGPPYKYSARAVVAAIEELQSLSHPGGTYTPSTLFGTAFAESIEGEKIQEAL